MQNLPSLNDIRAELARRVSILEAMQGVFVSFFQPAESWVAWKAFLAVLFGLPLQPDALALFREHTGRTTERGTAFRESHLIVGRRGGKSRIVALIAVFLACFKDYRPYLAPGERAMIMVIAADKRQARAIFRYIVGMIMAVPMLAEMVQGEPRADGVDFTNGVSIEIQAASFRSIRGYAIAAALCDEIAFWRTEDSANPDHEIIKAVRPGMATIPGAMLICLSSPYAQKGVLYEAYRDHYGRDDSKVLVWNASTAVMHPTLDPEIIELEFEKDAASAASEYGADGHVVFRKDIEGFLTQEDIKALTAVGVVERGREIGKRYIGFVDPSGGTRDSYTFAIAHKEGPNVVLDLAREAKSPLSPEAVTEEFAVIAKAYGLDFVMGDQYAGKWPREMWQKKGVEYRLSKRNKSDIYRDLLPIARSRQCELLDQPTLRKQLTDLERRTSRGGKDSIDHPPGGKDDVANAAAGAIVEAMGKTVNPGSIGGTTKTSIAQGIR